MDLQITVDSDPDGRTILALKGSLDLLSRAALLETAQNAAPQLGLVLDLAGLEFVDSSGIGAIVQLAGECEDAEQSFALRAPSVRVTRILEITGLLDAWTIERAT